MQQQSNASASASPSSSSHAPVPATAPAGPAPPALAPAPAPATTVASTMTGVSYGYTLQSSVDSQAPCFDCRYWCCTLSTRTDIWCRLMFTAFMTFYCLIFGLGAHVTLLTAPARCVTNPFYGCFFTVAIGSMLLAVIYSTVPISEQWHIGTQFLFYLCSSFIACVLVGASLGATIALTAPSLNRSCDLVRVRLMVALAIPTLASSAQHFYREYREKIHLSMQQCSSITRGESERGTVPPVGLVPWGGLSRAMTEHILSVRRPLPAPADADADAGGGAASAPGAGGAVPAPGAGGAAPAADIGAVRPRRNPPAVVVLGGLPPMAEFYLTSDQII